MYPLGNGSVRLALALIGRSRREEIGSGVVFKKDSRPFLLGSSSVVLFRLS